MFVGLSDDGPTVLCGQNAKTTRAFFLFSIHSVTGTTLQTRGKKTRVTLLRVIFF